MLAVIISKLLNKLLKIMIIIIVLKELSFTIITAFSYLHKKYTFINIFTIGLLYFFGL